MVSGVIDWSHCTTFLSLTTELIWHLIRSKDGNFIEKDERRYPDGSTLVIENATSEKDAGVYLCRTDNMEAEGGARFGQYIHLRGR